MTLLGRSGEAWLGFPRFFQGRTLLNVAVRHVVF